MEEFTSVEKALLKEIRMNSAWATILDKLEDDGRLVPAYRPDDPKTDDEDRKKNEWIFWSGVDRGRKDLLKRLRDG